LKKWLKNIILLKLKGIEMIRPCCGCGKENDCRCVCIRYFEYLDSIDEEPKPILTAEEKKMDRFNAYSKYRNKK